MNRQLPAPIEGSVEYGRLGKVQAFRLGAAIQYQGYEHDRCVHGWSAAPAGEKAWALFVDLTGSTPVATGIPVATADEARVYAQDTYSTCTGACCIGGAAAADAATDAATERWVRFEESGRLKSRRWHQVRSTKLGAVTHCGLRLHATDKTVAQPGSGARCANCALAAQRRP
jgi:hypothetical protein